MKRRCDRNHIVYQILCVTTGERYIGITVVRGRAFQKSLKMRWQGHIYHATVEQRNYPLQQRIRQYGENNFLVSTITIIRGKKAAHELERQLIKETLPELNVECTTKKRRKTPVKSL